MCKMYRPGRAYRQIFLSPSRTVGRLLCPALSKWRTDKKQTSHTHTFILLETPFCGLSGRKMLSRSHRLGIYLFALCSSKVAFQWTLAQTQNRIEQNRIEQNRIEYNTTEQKRMEFIYIPEILFSTRMWNRSEYEYKSI